MALHTDKNTGVLARALSVLVLAMLGTGFSHAATSDADLQAIEKQLVAAG